MISADKIKVVQAISAMIWQSIYSICFLIAFFVVLFYLIDSKTTFDAVKFGSIESVLGATLYVSVKYWFPGVKDDKPKQRAPKNRVAENSQS